MPLNCGAREDSWESLGQQDQTSQSYRKSTLNIHWKDWCWRWSSNTLATWCEKPTHWERPWCWEGRRRRGWQRWDDWMASQTPWTWLWASSGRWWRPRKPGMLQSLGSQRVNTTEKLKSKTIHLLLTILQCLKTSNIYCQIFYHCHYSFYFIFSLQICPFFSIFFLLVFYFLFTFSPKLENLNYFLHPCSECQLFRLIVIPFPGNCFFGSNCCYCPQRLTWSWEGVAGYSPHHPDAPHTHTHPTCHRPGPGTRSRADRACYSNVTGPGLWLSHAKSFTVVYTHWRRGRKVRLTLYGHWAGKIFFKPRTWSNE